VAIPFREPLRAPAGRGMFRDPPGAAPGMRPVDATAVREPGRTGSLWGIHHPVRVPSLPCGRFSLAETGGRGAGESSTRFPAAAGDHPVGDRGHSAADGIAHVADAGGYVPVRVNTGPLPLRASDGGRLSPLREVRNPHRPGAVSAWPAATGPGGASDAVAGRVRAIRGSDAAVATAEKTP